MGEIVYGIGPWPRHTGEAVRPLLEWRAVTQRVPKTDTLPGPGPGIEWVVIKGGHTRGLYVGPASVNPRTLYDVYPHPHKSPEWVAAIHAFHRDLEQRHPHAVEAMGHMLRAVMQGHTLLTFDPINQEER